jgi:hypothetical protein
MNHEDTHHHPASQEPTPATLLEDRTATIQFDGLILGAYDQARRLYQAGVHVNAEDHHLVITVTQNKKPIWPKKPSDWDSSLSTVRTLAPFWLFVDSGNGLNPKSFNASLYKPKDMTDPLSFGKIFSFVRRHGRELKLNMDQFAEFNFPHGTAYSALNADAQLGQLEPGASASTATFLENINVSSLGAIDIPYVSDGQTKQELVLAGDGGKREFFRLPLEAGATYEIKMDNRPIHDHGGRPPDPGKHFLQYYELFSKLNPGEKQFLVQLRPSGFSAADSPPCVGSSGSTEGGLGGG